MKTKSHRIALQTAANSALEAAYFSQICYDAKFSGHKISSSLLKTKQNVRLLVPMISVPRPLEICRYNACGRGYAYSNKRVPRLKNKESGVKGETSGRPKIVYLKVEAYPVTGHKSLSLPRCGLQHPHLAPTYPSSFILHFVMP